MSERNKPTYILVNISSTEEVFCMFLIRLEDIPNLSTLLPPMTNQRPLETLVATFNSYGECIGYKRNILPPGTPISTLTKRLYYSVLLLLKELNISYDRPLPDQS